jgi:hypothetical protein
MGVAVGGGGRQIEHLKEKFYFCAQQIINYSAEYKEIK